MRHMLLPIALLLGAAACDGNSGTDPIDRLVDPFEFVTSECEELVLDDGRDCDELEGASSWGVAQITFNDDDDQTISGTYYWTLVANEAWKLTPDWTGSQAGANGDDYCTLALGLSGTWTEGSSVCGACDKGVTYNTSFDASQTTCPDALVAAERGRLDGIEGATWGVEILDDGSARGWDTSRMWATDGESDKNGVVLWGYNNCSWFGADECT